jgi:hypothetical protein
VANNVIKPTNHCFVIPAIRFLSSGVLGVLRV